MLMRSAAAVSLRGSPPPSRGTRLLQFNASTYDATTHAVEAILSTGARVNRYSFQEELLVSAEAVDLQRAQMGQVKLLDSHNVYGLGAVLGTVSNVRIQGGNLVGLLTFDQSEQGIAAEGQVARGVVTGVSIGYGVKIWTLAETSPEGDAPDIWRATSWELLEVSLVSVPADPGAGTRSASPVPVETAFAENGDDMLTRNHPAGGDAPAFTQPPARFTADEALTFLDHARSYGLEEEARRMVRENIAPDAARRQIMTVAAERQRAATAFAGSGMAAQVTRDEGDTIRQGIEDALVSRIERTAPSERGRQFRSMSMVDMIRYQMRQRGERNVDFLSAHEIVQRMHTTGDFPTLLTGAGNRVLMQAFATAPNPLKDLARKTTVDDFRSKYSVKLGALPTLPLVIEGGEVKHLSTSESYENYKANTYAGIFSLSRQAIINDDLDAFGDWSGLMSRAASDTEAALLVSLLTANSGTGPVMVDGNALFSVAHGNLAGSGAAVSTDSLSAARLAMRTQKGIDGKTLAPVVPKTLLVSATKETEGEKILASLSAATADNVNTFAGKLNLAVEPRLTGNPWYVFSDPEQSPVLEFAYLTNAAGPQLESKAGWETLGMDFRVTLDFGCGVIDYRGAYRNPGA
jgi:HK97 family phage prohead protease